MIGFKGWKKVKQTPPITPDLNSKDNKADPRQRASTLTRMRTRNASERQQTAVKLNHGVSGAKGVLTTALATASPHHRFLRKCEQRDRNVEKRYFNAVTAQMHARKIGCQIQNRRD